MLFLLNISRVRFLSGSCSLLEPSCCARKTQQDGIKQRCDDNGAKSVPLYQQGTANTTRNQTSSGHREYCKNVNQVSSYSVDGELDVLEI